MSGCDRRRRKKKRRRRGREERSGRLSKGSCRCNLTASRSGEFREIRGRQSFTFPIMGKGSAIEVQSGSMVKGALMAVKRGGIKRLREQIREGGEGKEYKIYTTEREEDKIGKIEERMVKKREK